MISFIFELITTHKFNVETGIRIISARYLVNANLLFDRAPPARPRRAEAVKAQLREQVPGAPEDARFARSRPPHRPLKGDPKRGDPE